eukprot:scaffold222843_cov21-Tisochrysis_lutea.AAC.2
MDGKDQDNKQHASVTEEGGLSVPARPIFRAPPPRTSLLGKFHAPMHPLRPQSSAQSSQLCTKHACVVPFQHATAKSREETRNEVH